jgi:hypothetical protein
MKTCNNCHRAKPESEFSKDRSKRDGLQAKCKTCLKAITKGWSDANKERHLKQQSDWYKANKEQHYETGDSLRRTYPEKNAAKTAAYKAAKLQATPPWADLEAIAAIYAQAAEAGLEVDHIVPLQHKLVCGLHVHWNLQLLTPAANRAKGNKFDGGCNLF